MAIQEIVVQQVPVVCGDDRFLVVGDQLLHIECVDPALSIPKTDWVTKIDVAPPPGPGARLYNIATVEGPAWDLSEGIAQAAFGLPARARPHDAGSFDSLIDFRRSFREVVATRRTVPVTFKIQLHDG